MSLIVYLITVNVLGLVLMLADKRKAQKKTWRIPEHVLLGTAVIGGSLGVLVGMYAFWHKIRHSRFRNGVPLIIALHILIAFIVYVLFFYN